MNENFTDPEEALEHFGLLQVEAITYVRHEGTLVLFQGSLKGRQVVFAVEHRLAPDIARAIDAGEHPICGVPPYMIISEASET